MRLNVSAVQLLPRVHFKTSQHPFHPKLMRANAVRRRFLGWEAGLRLSVLPVSLGCCTVADGATLIGSDLLWIVRPDASLPSGLRSGRDVASVCFIERFLETMETV